MALGRTRLAIVALLLIAFAQMAYAIRGTSMTIDEGLHVTSGYTILTTGDYRLVEEHPPLIKLWLALPLLPVTDLPDVTLSEAWTESTRQTLTESLPLLHLTQQWFYPYSPIDRLVVPARLMASLLGILLLAALARWTHMIWGNRAMLWATALAVFDPNLIAHGAVATTDIGSSAFMLLSLLTMLLLFKHLSAGRALLAGVVMGLALTSKLTAVLLAPALLLIGVAALVRALRAQHDPRRQARRVVGVGLLALLAGGITFWAVYGFQFGPVPGSSLRLPAPAHAIPILRFLSHAEDGHQSYLLGMHSNHGWWFYFPVAAVLKTPLPALIAGLCALGVLAWRRARPTLTFGGQTRTASPWPLITFTLVYGLTSLTSSLNIGYRHLLPIVPSLYILAGALTKAGAGRGASSVLRRLIPLLGGALLLWQALGTVRILPYVLGFHNEVAGGSGNGWRYLADSNTDWGQGYKAMAELQASGALPDLRLSAFVLFDPALYGVTYEALTPLRGDTPPVFPSRFAPPPGHYAISMTPLDGIPTADPEMFDWFRWRVPDATIAYALRYYHVTAEETATAWLAQCTDPVAPLDASAIREGFGAEDPRVVAFDCTQSWIYPRSTDHPGVYALHGAQVADTLRARLHYAAPHIEDSFIRRHLSNTDIIYRQRAYRDTPSFALYRSAAGATAPAAPGWADPGWADPAWAAPAETPPDGTNPGNRQMPPFDLAGPLRFLGTASYAGGDTLEVETWWEVLQPANGRPLSLMAHLLLPDGSVLGVADGLGVQPAEWLPGDVLVQRHRFDLTGQPAEGLRQYVLRTGAYWLDTGERWRILTGSEAGERSADAIFVPIAP